MKRKFTVSIYVLKCPKTNKIYYVGASTDLAARYKSHSISVTSVGNWFKSLAKKKLKPVMVEIEQIHVESEYAYLAIHDQKAREAEYFFITLYTNEGHPLLNERGVKNPNQNIILLNKKAA